MNHMVSEPESVGEMKRVCMTRRGTVGLPRRDMLDGSRVHGDMFWPWFLVGAAHATPSGKHWRSCCDSRDWILHALHFRVVVMLVQVGSGELLRCTACMGEYLAMRWL